MENWYSAHEIGRLRHLEIERKYGNPHLLRAYAEKKRQKKIRRSRLYRKGLAAFGRFLETWGQALQKKFQTC